LLEGPPHSGVPASIPAAAAGSAGVPGSAPGPWDAEFGTAVLELQLLPHEPWAVPLPANEDEPSLPRARVLYSVAIVDLDPKPLSRVPHYVSLERQLRHVSRSDAGRLLAAAAGKDAPCLP
jgi:hypothetical protein